jgi:hypothetical protein
LAQARPDFSGTWSLDRSISDDPAQANFEPSRQQNNRRLGGFGGGSRRGGRGGLGGIGGGSRPVEGGPAGGSPADDRTPDERTRLRALTDQLRKGSGTLVISHHDPSFVINDAQNQTQFFQTNDSTDENHVASATVTSTTHWEGSRLLTEYALSSRLKLVFAYSLLAATKQMVLRVRLDDTQRRVTGQELKLVYSVAPASPK